MENYNSSLDFDLCYLLANSHSKTEMVSAILKRNSIDVIKFDKNRKLPLFVAVSNLHCDVDVIRFLIMKGASIHSRNESRETPLHVAVCTPFCSKTLINGLFALGASVDARDINHDTPLHTSAKNLQYNLSIIELLLNKGADINAVNYKGDSPLHLALRNPNCSANLVELLIKGTDINAKNIAHHTPLQIYLQNPNCKSDIVKQLIAHGANLYEIDELNNGWSILHYAVKTDDSYAILLEIMKKLSKLKHASKTFDIINEVDYFFNTALHLALDVETVDINVVWLLLSYGIDYTIRNLANESPLHIAVKNPNYNLGVIHLLLESGDLFYEENDYLTPYNFIFGKYSLLPEKYQPCVWLLAKYAVLHNFKKCAMEKHDHVSQAVNLWRAYRRDLSRYIKDCFKELNRMQHDILGKNYTFLDLLLNSKENQEIKQFTENVFDELLHIKYPIYYNALANCFDRLELLLECSKQHNFYMYAIKYQNDNSKKVKIILPLDCFNNIMKYLHKVDLLNVILAFHSLNNSFCTNKKQKKV